MRKEKRDHETFLINRTGSSAVNSDLQPFANQHHDGENQNKKSSVKYQQQPT